MQMRNSLTLSKEETEALIAASTNNMWYVSRLNRTRILHVNDLIRGEVVINSSILDDKVLYKSLSTNCPRTIWRISWTTI